MDWYTYTTQLMTHAEHRHLDGVADRLLLSSVLGSMLCVQRQSRVCHAIQVVLSTTYVPKECRYHTW